MKLNQSDIICNDASMWLVMYKAIGDSFLRSIKETINNAMTESIYIDIFNQTFDLLANTIDVMDRSIAIDIDESFIKASNETNKI